MKICTECNQIKRLTDFYVAKSNSDGLKNSCTECDYWRGVQYKYKLSRRDWFGMLEAQGGECLLCPEAWTAELRPRFAVDHRHSCCDLKQKDTKTTCGRCVRGLLCSVCNYTLGIVENQGGDHPALNQEWVSTAVRYARAC